MTRRQPARPSALMLAAVLALAGCASSSPTSPAQQASAAATTLTPTATPTPAPVPVVVVRVIDGDTVDVRPATPHPTDPARTERVRLLGIDAPETAHDQPAQCGAEAATDALTEQLRHRPVTLTLDPISGHHDRYGRTLGYLDAGGHDTGLALIKAGRVETWHPKSTPAPTRYPAYASAQTAAQQKQVGSWATCPTLGR